MKIKIYESEWLYKNHFDIHDLISQDLAIDINKQTNNETK